MTKQQRIEAMEASLRAACVEVQAQGLVLVRDALEAFRGRKVVGVCALGAYCRAPSAAYVPMSAKERDAIEHGWDGTRAHAEREGLPMPWFELGARLAAEFQPVAASSLEAR